MKKTIAKISVVVFIITLLITLIIKTPYYKAMRDGAFPSLPQNVILQANANEEEITLSYKWKGFKEFNTYSDYIIIQYNSQNIDFIDDGIDGRKDFHKLDRYLHGSIPSILQGSSEKEIVIPIDRNSRNDEISVPIKNRDANIEGTTAYYAHIVMLPMDMPSGWISEKINISN